MADERPHAGGSGFYGSVLDDETRTKALAVDGVTDEIALLRLKFLQLTEDKEQLERILKCGDAIVRAVRLQFQMQPKDAQEFGEAAARVIQEMTRDAMQRVRDEEDDDV
jgi:hypothetical protein